MNNDLLEHRGYYGSVQYSAEDDCLIGKVEFIDDLILFNAEDVPSLKAAFVEAVDDYLASCAAEGQQPNTTCRGSFNVRIGVDAHKKAAQFARQRQQSLNDFVKDAVVHFIELASLPSPKKVVERNPTDTFVREFQLFAAFSELKMHNATHVSLADTEFDWPVDTTKQESGVRATTNYLGTTWSKTH